MRLRNFIFQETIGAHAGSYILFQKVGLWFSCLNSAENPFVYMCVIPAFMQSLRRTCTTLCFKKEIGESNRDDSDSLELNSRISNNLA